MENTITRTKTSSSVGTVHLHAPVVMELKELIDNNIDLKVALELSIITAVGKAYNELNSDLYHAIDRVFKGNGWPITLEAYYNYLDQYVRLVPNEETDPLYPAAWTTNDKQNGYNQKVYDLLCQFYWFVNQSTVTNDTTLQNSEAFSQWLVDFATSWGEFLDTEESLTKESLNSFKFNPMYNFHLYSDGETTWKTFNEFFYREFNQAAPGTRITPLRPIAAPNDNNTITAPADCTFKMNYPISDNGNVLDEHGRETKVTLKNTHSIGTVDELLDNSPYAKDFYGGTFVHYFLGPFDYHRFHTSVSGEVLEIRDVQGKVFLDVDLTSDGQWDAPDGAKDGYEFVQARGIVIVDTKSTVGKIAILPIGMAQVSGVQMDLDLQGKTVVKGQEFGKFAFGGSDIIVLFEKAAVLYLFKKDPGHIPIHFQYGQTIAYANENTQL